MAKDWKQFATEAELLELPSLEQAFNRRKQIYMNCKKRQERQKHEPWEVKGVKPL